MQGVANSLLIEKHLKGRRRQAPEKTKQLFSRNSSGIHYQQHSIFLWLNEFILHLLFTFGLITFLY